MPIKLRSAQRIGELARDLDKAAGRPGKNLPSVGKNYPKAKALADAGISTSAANDYEQSVGECSS